MPKWSEFGMNWGGWSESCAFDITEPAACTTTERTSRARRSADDGIRSGNHAGVIRLRRREITICSPEPDSARRTSKDAGDDDDLQDR